MTSFGERATGLREQERLRLVLLRLWEHGYSQGQHAPATWSERDGAIDAALSSVLPSGEGLTVERLADLLYDRFARVDHERQDMARIRADTVARWLLPRLGAAAPAPQEKPLHVPQTPTTGLSKLIGAFPDLPAPSDVGAAVPSDAAIEAALEACPVLWDVQRVSQSEVDLVLPRPAQAREAVQKILNVAYAIDGPRASSDAPSREPLDRLRDAFVEMLLIADEDEEGITWRDLERWKRILADVDALAPPKEVKL